MFQTHPSWYLQLLTYHSLCVAAAKETTTENGFNIMFNDDTHDEGMPENTEHQPTEDSTNDDQGYQFEDAESTNEPMPSSDNNGGGRRYANEVFSKTIHAKFRTFYIDLKESVNGKFLKLSEKSRGRKTTIMMDAEDVPAMIEALKEAQEKL